MLLSGEPKVYVKVGESGNRREQRFYAECGPRILLCASRQSRPRRLRVGAIRQSDQLSPIDQHWFRSAQKWLQRRVNRSVLRLYFCVLRCKRIESSCGRTTWPCREPCVLSNDIHPNLDKPAAFVAADKHPMKRKGFYVYRDREVV